MIAGGEEMLPSLDPNSGEEVDYEDEEARFGYIYPLDEILTSDNSEPIEYIIDLLSSRSQMSLNVIEKVCTLLARCCECNQ